MKPTVLVLLLIPLTTAWVSPVLLSAPHGPLHAASLSFDEAAYDTYAAAEQCINGECPLPEAENLLSEVLTVQAHCVTSESHEAVCDDVLLAAELIAGLREKIGYESGRAQRTVKRKSSNFGSLLGFNGDVGVLDPLENTRRTEYVAMAVFFALLVSEQTIASSTSLTPFTAQEWMWSVRDGYFTDMFRHGGAGLPLAAEDVSPFTAQEWIWSVRDGYFLDMFGHGGGL